MTNQEKAKSIYDNMISFQEGLNILDREVNFIYVIGKDMVANPGYEQRAYDRIDKLNDWLGGELERHGFPPLRIKYNKEIKVVQSDIAFEDVVLPDGSKVYQPLVDASQPYRKSVGVNMILSCIYKVHEDGTKEYRSRHIASANENGGWAVTNDIEGDWSVGTAGHELLHACGVNHTLNFPGDGEFKSMMSSGNHSFPHASLSFASACQLIQSNMMTGEIAGKEDNRGNPKKLSFTVDLNTEGRFPVITGNVKGLPRRNKQDNKVLYVEIEDNGPGGEYAQHRYITVPDANGDFSLELLHVREGETKLRAAAKFATGHGLNCIPFKDTVYTHSIDNLNTQLV